MLAKLYKIVAFLTWLETYGPVTGRVPTQRVQDLVVGARAARYFVGYFVWVWVATVLLLAGRTQPYRIAPLGMMGGHDGYRARAAACAPAC